MNLASALFGKPERRFLSIDDMDAMMDARINGPMSSVGLAINPDSAMQSAVVYACVNVLAQTIASLPLLVYRRLSNGGKERAPEHRLYSILHDQANPEMTAYEFRACLVGHVCLWGDAYAEIERSDAGINALWPLRPDQTKPKRDDNGNLVYDYRLPNGEVKRFQFWQIMHWRGLSSNGINGYSPIAMAAESVGLDLATRQYGAKFFGNDSRPGGMLSTTATLNNDKALALKERWESAHKGLSNANRVAVMDSGITFTAIGIPPEQSQFLESRKYGRSEIAGLYRVPLHLINDLERSTFSNIEHQSLEFVKYSIVPWLVQIEQAIKRDLFAISDGKRSMFAEHLVDGLLRGDSQARAAYFQVQRQNGIISADEWRALDNMNPIGGDEGSTYLWPANYMPAQKVLEPPKPPPVPLIKPAPDQQSTDENAPQDGKVPVSGNGKTGGNNALGNS